MKTFIRTKNKWRLKILLGIITLATMLVKTVAATDNSINLADPSPLREVSSQAKISESALDEIIVTYARLPLRFETNSGQTDARVKYLTRNTNYTLFFMPTEIAIAFNGHADVHKASENKSAKEEPRLQLRPSGVVRMQLTEANQGAEIKGMNQLPGFTNYLVGNDPRRWHTHVPNFSHIEYREIYPGIHLVFYGNRDELEFDFIVTPGANPDDIRLSFEGVENMLLDERDNLIVQTSAGKLHLRKPIIYQENHGIRKSISGGFVLDDHHQVRLQVSAFDTQKPLVIDPVLHYSTFLGGEGSDKALDVALDPEGNVIITGYTSSTDFPLQNPVRDDLLGSRDAFVTKFNPTLSSIIYSTYLGGNGEDYATSVASDLDGNAYITGSTQSINFPVTDDAIDNTCGSDGFCDPYISNVGILQNTDAFVTKLNSAGNLVYSTYLGGSESDFGRGIAVDGVGSIYVAGGTRSTDFPATSGAFQTSCVGPNPVATWCDWDVFVTKFNPSGSTLMYSTFFGGSNRDEAYDIALDTSPGLASAAYVAGFTASVRDFPSTPGAIQDALNGNDGFVMKLNALGNSIVYATSLGGSDSDWISGIAVDDLGNAYVIGTTSSNDFPTSAGAFDTTCGTDGNCNNTGTGNWVDAFVSKLNPTGTALLYSTYLGGINKEFGEDITVHISGGNREAYVTGKTLSPDFPVVNPIQGTYGESEHTGGNGDVFVTRFNAAGSNLVFSTYLGGGGPDGGWGITVDANGNSYITGNTTSDDFPATLGAYQSDLQNPPLVRGDAFVARIGEGFVIPPFDLFWQLVIYLIVLFLVGLIFFGPVSRYFQKRSPRTYL